jgi:hypothetical protein
MHNQKASEHARERRRQKAERRRRREVLDAKGKDKDKDGYNRSRTHELAFFYPVPLLIGFGSCVTGPFVVNGACAAVSVFSLCYVARLIDESGVCASRAWEVVWQHVWGWCVQAGASAVVVVAHAEAEAEVALVEEAIPEAEVDAVAAADVVEVAEEADSHPCMMYHMWPNVYLTLLEWTKTIVSLGWREVM